MSPEEMNEFLTYGMLQDTIMLLGTNALVKASVGLYRMENNNRRQYFYTESQYMDKNGFKTRKIERYINAFLSIENVKVSNGVKEFIILRGRDLELLRMFLLPKLESIMENFNKIFELRDGKLYCNDIVKPIEIILSTREKAIWLKPGIHQLATDEKVPCLELYLNNPNIVSILNIPAVYDFMYLIRSFDLFQYAGNMLSYFGRPQLGHNLVDFTPNQIERRVENMSYRYEEPKQIKLKRKKGFFDIETGKQEENNNGTT